jgi:hypothetical protein
VPAAPSFGELSGRLQDLFAKTVKPGPYEVTDKILIRPPTKGEWERLDALRAERQAAQFALGALVNFIGTEGGPTTADLEGLSKTAIEADAAYDKLFFGEHHDSIKALSANWQRAEWIAFCDNIQDYFRGIGPATGACPNCGNVIDEEQAGKDATPST